MSNKAKMFEQEMTKEYSLISHSETRQADVWQKYVWWDGYLKGLCYGNVFSQADLAELMEENFRLRAINS